jgi:methylphosphotriester-DNA--protein-cysteine methyltransferase
VLSEWGKQADALSSALNQLATQPSMQNLSSAKASLSLFRSQFQRWMQQQAVTQPYQVQAWDNRLATIEQLLRYGERTVLNQQRKAMQ